jgi:hypothetical protein
MNRRTVILTAVAAALVSASLATIPAAGATPPTPPDKSPRKSITPLDQIPAEDAGDQISKLATNYADAFAGTEWDAKSQTLYVNIAAPRGKQADRRAAFQQAISSKLRSAKTPVKTIFRTVPLSLAGQDALLHDFLDGRAAWGGESARRKVVSASIDPKTGRLDATVTGDLASLQEAAHRRFGDAVSLRLGRPPQEQYGGFDRYGNGGYPYWASGIPLWETYVVGLETPACTAGFKWKRWSDDLRYASTAGHCWAPGTNVFYTNTQQRMGYVGTKYLNNGENIDFEFIRLTVGAPDNSIAVGGKFDTNNAYVTMADNDGTNTGVEVCSSGANSGLVCGKIINRKSAVVRLSGVITYNLTCVEADSRLTLRGDSGGPWLSTDSAGHVKAWGQHLGTADCDNDGADEMVFSTVKNISARVGATLVTTPTD